MVGCHHCLNGHEFEQAPGVGNGQGVLVCCSPWGRKQSDTTEWLNWSLEPHALGPVLCTKTPQWEAHTPQLESSDLAQPEINKLKKTKQTTVLARVCVNKYSHTNYKYLPELWKHKLFHTILLGNFTDISILLKWSFKCYSKRHSLRQKKTENNPRGHV